jgi:hypothetical protein
MTTTQLTDADLAKNARIINTEHKAVIGATQAKLQHAITAGATLKACKDSMAHGDWTKWLDANCPEISERTASLYMRLAKNSDKLEKAAKENGNAVADLSVRGAAKVLANKRANGGGTKTSTRTATQASPTPPTLEEQFKAVAADEVFQALKDAGWKVEELNKLVQLLNAHLAERRKKELQKSPTGAPADLGQQAAGFVRRT